MLVAVLVFKRGKYRKVLVTCKFGGWKSKTVKLRTLHICTPVYRLQSTFFLYIMFFKNTFKNYISTGLCNTHAVRLIWVWAYVWICTRIYLRSLLWSTKEANAVQRQRRSKEETDENHLASYPRNIERLNFRKSASSRNK